MRRALLLILIFVPLWLAAQDMPFETRTKTRFSTSGMIGIEQVDSLKFYRARLIQEFKVWKIGIGLDLDFLFDEDFGLRVSDWDHLENLLDKFYYVKYAGRRDPYYAHLGGFPDMTIGNGLIMKKYSNMDLYPALRNAGLMIGANPNIATSPSFEIFSSNLKRNEIMSLSARARPMPDSTIRVLDEMIVGMSLVVDRNQNANLKYVVPDSLHSLIPQKRDSAMVMGIAYSLPFYRTKNYTVGQYAEFAHIAGLGSGAILPGIYIDFDFIKVNLEYRVYGSKFTPAFFDEDYETERGYVLIDSLSNVRFRTKEDFVKTLKPAKGINGTVQG
ncbi:MAG: hypothetical protein U1B83_09745, partial [Candidatus Cloacimonadaceae bacterium]|nr:hypothetical protein [Candidatus Cloacimonadaceae bacterium]